MASNKKAQILAAVMCASSIFGSYTVVSAADTPTKIESTDKNSSVTANGSTITATAGAQGSQQSTITLGNKSLAINVGKQTTTDGITYGAFTLNSSNLAVNNSGLSVKNTKGIVVGSISNTGAITGTGLTIKNGTGTTLASLNNNGLNIYDGINTKATATITKAGAITGTGLTVKAVSDTIKPEGDYVESKVTTSGVADTIKQGGFTRATSNVTTNSIKDTIYTDSGIELSSINVFKNTAANGIENGKVSLTAKKIVTDNQTSTTTTSTLTLGGDNASLKVGNYGFTVDSNNNVLFSGKNASLTSTGLTVNGTGTSSIKSTNTNENSSTVGSYTKNDISYNGMTTTAKGGKYPSDSDNDNKTTSSVTYTGVRDTVYDDSGNIKSTSVVDTNGVTLTSNRYDTGSKISSSLTIKGDSATLTSGTAYVKVDNTVGNVTLSGKNASLTSTGLTVNGTGTSSIKSTNATTEAYTKNDISYAGMTTTVRGGKNPSESDNVNKTTSAVTYTGVTDTVYDDGGNLKTKSSVTTSGITNTVNDVSTGKALANSSLTTSGISNTTSLKTTTGKIDTAINQNTSGVGITSTKYNTNDDVTDKTSLTMNGSANSITSIKYNDSNKTAETTSVSVNGATSSITSYGNYVYDDESGKATSYNQASMSLNGNTGTATIRGGSNTASSTLTLNEAGVALSGKNASLSGSTFTLKDTTNGKTLASLGASGLSLNKVNSDETTTNYGTWNSNGLTVNGTGYTTIKSTNATTGAMGQSQVSYNGVTDTVTNGTNTTTSTVGATGVTDTVTNASNQTLAQSQVNTAGITLTANKYDEENTKTSSSLSIKGDSATLTSGTAYVKVDNTLGNVTLSGNNATLSGSTFTLKDATNGKTLASLGASGLSINNADGIKVGGISNTGNLIANDGMNVTDKNSSWVNIGTSTMQKDIAATTTTSYAGITNKIDTTLAGNKTYTSGTVVGPTSVTTTVQGSNTTDAISGNKNKTTSTVSATGVTDTVYNVKGNQVASSSVTTNGIVNTTTNLSIDGSTNNTMSTSIYQDKRGISASATKKDENGTVGTSTLTLAGNSASLKVGNYGFAVDSNNNVSIAGNNATLSGSTFTLKDANGKTATLNTSGLTLKDEDGNTTGGISSTGAITGTSLRITTSEDTNGNKTVSTVATNGVTDTVTNNKTNNKTTSQVSANGVTDTVYGTDGTTKVASSSVSTSGISNTTSLKTTTGKIDTAINQNTSGVGISSTKYDTNNNVTDKTSVSVNGGTSSITSYGSYIYGEDGKATSYNQASISLNGNTGTATIRGGSNTASSTLTLNEAGVALSGKNVGLNANGLTLYKDVDGVKTQYASLSAGGLDVKGTGSTTIKSTNATTGAIGQSQVSYDGVTDSFTKDDVTNSVTTNANGTTFSSTENGSTTIKGDTIKTTNLIVNGKDIGGVATDVAGIDRNTENEDGLGYYTQIEGKTKIYNTGRFSTANGNFVVDPYGSITSKAGNYRFNMDRTSGFDLGYAATTSFTLDNTGVSLGFRNNSFILDKNGATFINANGENVSFTSINGGTITTGETVINGSSITTKDLYVDNIHLNGAITDGNGNVVGGGDLSLGADGTLDLKYNANGITNTFVSGATGVHSSFSNGTTTASSSVGYIDDKNTIGIKDQVGNTSVTTTTDGTTFANGSGSTTINGGNITTTGDVTVGGDLSVGDNFKVDGTTGNVTGGTYNGVQISTDKDGNAIIGGTNIGDLATNEEVNKVNDKVDAVDNKVGDTSKLDKEITDNQNYKDNQNLVGAVNAEADIRRNEISRIDGQIEQLDGRVGSLENRMSDVEDRIDKVGAMSAAIANLRTMGFDPEAPTEIAIGVGQYKSETGLALGVFHYPNQDFMLSASISTSGDEVMGGIGATWKLGRKSAAEKAKDEEARRLEKAEEMKKLAQDAKVKAQAERHAKLLAEREAQKTA